MRILHLSTYDSGGGAARAAVRLHESLRAAGVDSNMFVLAQTRDDPHTSSLTGPLKSLVVPALWRLARLPLARYGVPRNVPFSAGWLPDLVSQRLNRSQPDIVHLHWVNHGFVPVRAMPRFEAPIVWTLHDSWPFTGGCHLPGECVRYREICGSCPVLTSRREGDLSRRIWQRKAHHWRDVAIHSVAPSEWLAGCARASSLLAGQPVRIIPHGLDLAIYHPGDRQAARRALDLPQHKKLVLFGAHWLDDPNKGARELKAALHRLASEGWHDRMEVVTFGLAGGGGLPDFALPAHHLGYIDQTERMVTVYQAADVVVVPSRRETFGLVALEAQACGRPVVAFGASGLLDIVEHRRTGTLAEPYDAKDLAAGIAWVLADDERRHRLGEQARRKVVAEFGQDVIARRYTVLYEEILAQGTPVASP